MQREIKVGDRFLSDGVEGRIVSVTIDNVFKPVLWLSDDGKISQYHTREGSFLELRNQVKT